MTIERKLLGTADAGASQAVYIEDVMATYLYNGSGSTQTINNGIDLATKGGLVWIKNRSSALLHGLYDTGRGIGKGLSTNTISEQTTAGAGNELTSFNTNGFSIGPNDNKDVNISPDKYASWTFRKQPKFFDIVTYTGNGTSNRQIAHALGATPGMIIVKRTDATGNWVVYHKSFNENLYLNTTSGAGVIGGLFQISNNSTSTNIVLGSNSSETNASGATYVAYLFADSNSGGFGASGTDSVVACGSVADTAGTTVNLGWEPQFVLLKSTVRSGFWYIFDNMRGMSYTQHVSLSPNSANAQINYGTDPFDLLPNGFKWNYSNWNDSVAGETMIYMAIRRGPMKTPTDATKVFLPSTPSTDFSAITTGFPVDMIMEAIRTDGTYNYITANRLVGGSASGLGALQTSSTAAEAVYGDKIAFQSNTSVLPKIFSTASLSLFSFKRAPGFFDVVCYTGTGSATTVAHNLGVAPELMIVKSRNIADTFWVVYSAARGPGGYLYLNNSGQGGTNYTAYFNSTAPTATNFTVGTGGGDTNGSGYNFVAYLFATCPGVSKVGSVSHTYENQTNVDCGFTAGARFVLFKRTDSTGDWWVVDTARGIVSGNDPALKLNSTAAEVTNLDLFTPYSAGFAISANVFATGTYLYLAIA